MYSKLIDLIVSILLIAGALNLFSTSVYNFDFIETYAGQHKKLVNSVIGAAGVYEAIMLAYLFMYGHHAHHAHSAQVVDV